MGRCTNREEEGVEKREETDVATVSCRSPCRIHIQCRIEGGGRADLLQSRFTPVQNNPVGFREVHGAQQHYVV